MKIGKKRKRKKRTQLAKVIIIAPTLTLLEQNLQALRHIDPQKLVEVANDGGDSGEGDGLCDAVCSEVLSSESGYLQVKLDDKRSVETLYRTSLGEMRKRKEEGKGGGWD